MSIPRKLRQAGREAGAAEASIARASAPRGNGAPTKAVAAIGKLGDQPELRTLCAMVIAGGLLGSNRRLIRAGVRMLLAHELATLGKDLIKEQIDRTRPHSASSRRQSTIKPGRRTAKTETSFPSGHSAGSTAVARALGREYPHLQAPALAAAAIVSGMQVPRLNHYPTDVAAGMLLGALCEVAANLAVGDEEIKPEAPPPPPPPPRRA